MTLPRTLVAMLALGSGLGLGLGPSCYSERIPPSNFRYACDADADCGTLEVCRRGLCERPCAQVTAAEDCPSEAGYATCFNGVCANTCEPGASLCPLVQECLDFGIDIGASPGFGGGPAATVGICGIACNADENADLCPEGEICLLEAGVCAVDCSTGQACPEGNVCFFGVCLPEDFELPSDDSGDSGGSDSGDGSSGAAMPERQEER